MQNISAKYPDNSFSNVRVFGEIVFGEPEPSDYYIRWTGPYGGYGSFLVNRVISYGDRISSYYSNLADYNGVYTNFNGELRNYNDPQTSTICYTTFRNTYISTFETNAYHTEVEVGENGWDWVSDHGYLSVNARLKNVFLYRTKYISPFAFENCVCLSNVIMSKVVSIDTYAFKSCWALSSNIYLSKCKYIGYGAFMYCRDEDPYPYFRYPDVEYQLYGFYDFFISSVIRSYYFPDRYGTMSVVLPVCEYIGSLAFWSCNLTYLDAGNCSFIGENAFGPFGPSIVGRSSFTLILRGSSVCQTGGSQLGWPLRETTTSIYVPSSLVSDYKSAYQWRRLSSVIYPIPSSMTS